MPLTNLDLGLWQYLLMGYPHCLPPLMQVPQLLLVRSYQHGLSATGTFLPLLFFSIFVKGSSFFLMTTLETLDFSHLASTGSRMVTARITRTITSRRDLMMKLPALDRET